MSWQDGVNGAYEILGALAILQHCRVLYAHKVVRGVSYLASSFFLSWGVWNLYYYPHLDQWASFAGGCAIVAANALYFSMMLFYARRERQHKLSVREAQR